MPGCAKLSCCAIAVLVALLSLGCARRRGAAPQEAPETATGVGQADASSSEPAGKELARQEARREQAGPGAVADVPAVGSSVPQLVLPARPDWGKASRGVQCFVQSNKSSYVVGEPILVKLWARNVSQYRLMYLKPDVQDDKSRFWRIEPRTLLTRIKPQAQGSLRRSDYVVLRPGATSFAQVDLTTIYSFKPGSYTIRAHHTGANWYRRPDGAITEMDDCWTGTVTSNPVAITVLRSREGRSATAIWGGAVEGLQLGLRTDRTSCRAGESVRLTLALRHEGRRGPFRITNYPDSLSLTVDGPEGRATRQLSVWDPRHVPNRHWRGIAPRESRALVPFPPGQTGATVRLRTPGVYRLQATYAVDGRGPNSRRRWHPVAWEGGLVRSNVVSVTVVSPSDPKQALSVSVKVRDGTGQVERESMSFTTVWVSGMSLVFTVKNQTNRPVDPGIPESALLVNEKPLRDWGFVVASGPRDERWRKLPPGEEIAFTYGMGKYFAKTGHYRVQLVLGEAKSNVAEISVSPHCK